MVDGEDGGTPSPFGTSLTMDEIEAGAGGEAVKTDLDKTLAEGDEVPEAYRGKSVNEIIKIAEAARGQMNESTTAAREAAESARRATEAASSRREDPPPPPPKELTREELKAIYDEDPLKAIELIEQQAMSRVSAHVEQRLSAITEGTVGQAENWARQEYAAEFELFGDKIMDMVKSIPNKQVFASKKGWEDAVSYVRGQKGNFEKLMDHRSAKENEENSTNARTRQRETAGFSGRSTTGNTRGRDLSSAEATKGMGDDERAIAQRFIDDGTFKDMAEYKKWQRMGGA